MKLDRMIGKYILCAALGLVLWGLGTAEIVDEFWGGMGAALLAVGILRMVRWVRCHRDEDYREAVEIAATDERNVFIRNKAWAWAGYLFILVTAVLTIVLKGMGQELLSMAAAFAVWGMMLLYWGAYLVLKRKY